MKEFATTEEMLDYIQQKHPETSSDVILDLLVSCDASVENVLRLLDTQPSAASSSSSRYQSTLKRFFRQDSEREQYIKRTKISSELVPSDSAMSSGTLHLYSPDQVAMSGLPCTFHLNVFPKDLANELLEFLVNDCTSWSRRKFYLFDREVTSPHSSGMYSNNSQLLASQKATYNGENVSRIRPFNYLLDKAGIIVQRVVREEIKKRGLYKYQSSTPWYCDVVLANCYADKSESVGFHADQLTHIGPGAVIASVSLGVTREFRLIAKTNNNKENNGKERRRSSPVSVHLPHNSLIIMHAGCQEQYKHSLMPSTQPLTPHPISGQKRLNLTYRMYLPELSEEKIPKCYCKRPMILRAIPETISCYKYLWQCSSSYVNQPTCGYTAYLDPATVTSVPSNGHHSPDG